MSCSRNFFICYLLDLKSDFNRKEQKRQKLWKNYHLIIHNSATENSGTLREFKNMWAKGKEKVNVIKKPRQHLPAQNQKIEILKHSLENV